MIVIFVLIFYYLVTVIDYVVKSRGWGLFLEGPKSDSTISNLTITGGGLFAHYFITDN